MAQFQVHVTKDYLVFCAGHFITYGNNQCEALHGHNYHVGVWISGDVNEHHYVFDFVMLKRVMKRLVDELDHRMLLPTDNPRISIVPADEGVWVHVGERGGRRYFFPQEDIVQLPMPNTTAEMLAQYLCQRLKAELPQLEPRVGHLAELTVEVEETPGQSGFYREEFAL